MGTVRLVIHASKLHVFTEVHDRTYLFRWTALLRFHLWRLCFQNCNVWRCIYHVAEFANGSSQKTVYHWTAKPQIQRKLNSLLWLAVDATRSPDFGPFKLICRTIDLFLRRNARQILQRWLWTCSFKRCVVFCFSSNFGLWWGSGSDKTFQQFCHFDQVFAPTKLEHIFQKSLSSIQKMQPTKGVECISFEDCRKDLWGLIPADNVLTNNLICASQNHCQQFWAKPEQFQSNPSEILIHT